MVSSWVSWIVGLPELDQAPEHGFEFAARCEIFETPIQDVIFAGIIEAALHRKFVTHEKERDARGEKAERIHHARLLLGPVVSAPAELRDGPELVLGLLPSHQHSSWLLA